MAEPSTNTEMVRVPILGENGRISDDYIPESIPQAVTAVGQAAEAAASSANEALQKAAAAEKAASSASSSAEQAKSYASNANTYMTTAESHAVSAATDAQAASASASASAAAASAAAAEESNKSAAQSSADAMGFRNSAVQYRDQAREAAQEAKGYVTTVQQLEQNATNSATAAQNSATSASASAETAATAETNASASATAAAASAQTASQKADAVLDHYIEFAQATTLEFGSQATATVADKVLQLGIPKGEKGDTGLGIPEGGSAGQVVKKTADGTEWAYDTGAVYNSEEGLQEMAEDGTHDPIYNFGITQGGMSASMSVMGDSPEVAADYSAASVSYRNAIGADADGPYVDLNLTGKTGGATKYRYVDDPSQFATADGIPTAKAVASAIGGGNVLKGTLGPAPLLSADDAYATKPRKLAVHGATRQNLWVNPSGLNRGVTVTTNSDGSFTLSGATTENNVVFANSPQLYSLKVNTTYTLSCNVAIDSPVSFAIQYRANGESSAITDMSITGSETSVTFTTPAKFEYYRCVLHASTPVTVSGTYRVMLNEGSEPEPWCPPGLNSVEELSIVTAGKNIASTEYDNTVSGGITFNTESDGSISMVGTATSAYPQRSNAMNLPSNTDMVVSKTVTGYVGSGGYCYAIIYGVRGSEQKQIASTRNVDEAAFNTGEYDYWIFVVVAEGNGVTFDCKLYPQLEIGSTATAYEPPAVTSTPIDLDGNTLCSLPDGTHDELTIDATGAVTLTKRTQRVQLDGDANWSRYETPFVHYISSWSNFNGLPSGVVSENHYVDKLPASNRVPNGLYSANTNEDAAYVREPTFASDAAGVKTWMGTNKPIVIMPLLEPQTIPLPAVTLPTLPAPTVNVCADAEASGAGYAMDPDVELEYERDVTIAFSKLQAQVSELTVNHATS